MKKKITKFRKSIGLNLLSALPKRLSFHLFAAAPLHSLGKGQVLFRSGDAGDGCYRLEQGLVKITVTSPQGEERIIAILGSGAIVGELSMIDGLPRSASVVTFHNSTFRFVSRAAFEKCMQAHPEISKYLMTTLASRLREANEGLAATSFLTVKGRVARALLELADCLETDNASARNCPTCPTCPTCAKCGLGHILLGQRINQGDLAAMAGVARENVSRTMGEWRRRKLVLRSSNFYCITDRAELERETDL
jgi:CRP/FNR family cyclic AMP-dependent transcriptional regulator